MTETTLDPLEPTTSISDEPANPAPRSNWTIALSVKVDADARRIFQALTVPEYLEVWIVIPDQKAGSRLVASQDTNGYRLEHYSAGRVAFSIIGSYLFCHQRKMRLLWRKTCEQTCVQSLVDFRLRGNFASSILELRHSELDSPEEFFWHSKLWQGSLRNLASLVRSA